MTGNSFGVIQNIKKSTHAEHSRNKIKYKVVDHCEGPRTAVTSPLAAIREGILIGRNNEHAFRIGQKCYPITDSVGRYTELVCGAAEDMS